MATTVKMTDGENLITSPYYEVFHPSKSFRWKKSPSGHKAVLQQAWNGDMGSARWETVETVPNNSPDYIAGPK